MLDKNQIEELSKQGYTSSEIARVLNVSRQRIHQITKNYHNYGRSGREDKYRNFGLCDECKIESAKVLHHIDFNNTNDTIDNLQALCQKCHGYKHRKIDWVTINKKIYNKPTNEIKLLRCKRCLHQWYSKLLRPMTCARCKSYSWDMAREKKV